jgi:hypothetical protein
MAIEILLMEGPMCRFVEKHEPASDIATTAVDGLKALDPARPIREADIADVRYWHKADIRRSSGNVRFRGQSGHTKTFANDLKQTLTVHWFPPTEPQGLKHCSRSVINLARLTEFG